VIVRTSDIAALVGAWQEFVCNMVMGRYAINSIPTHVEVEDQQLKQALEQINLAAQRAKFSSCVRSSCCEY